MNIAPCVADTGLCSLTVLDTETRGPLFKGHLLVLVGVTLLEEAGCAVFHRHQRNSKGGQLRVGQEPAVQMDFNSYFVFKNAVSSLCGPSIVLTSQLKQIILCLLWWILMRKCK